MIARILLLLGYALTPVDPIARALASDILRGHDVAYLEPVSTQAELMRRYRMIAIEVGLPLAAADHVAALAWGYIAETQAEYPPLQDKAFSFYG